MADETYHGWANRETWAFHLWITNEQATDQEARRIVVAARRDAIGRLTDQDWTWTGDERACFVRTTAADALREWWAETLGAARDNGYADTLDAMRDDVGSLWRVDWRAVACALAEDDGDTAPPPAPMPEAATDDAAALDAIAHMLRDPEWGVGMLEDIAELVADTGRSCKETCAACDHPATWEPCNAAGCACAEHEPQSTWDRH
jgi:hypothetical protein